MGLILRKKVKKTHVFSLILPTERGVSKKVKRFMSSQISWELLREALLLFQGNNPKKALEMSPTRGKVL
jgi:accessory colonization factor AcfC